MSASCASHRQARTSGTAALVVAVGAGSAAALLLSAACWLDPDPEPRPAPGTDPTAPSVERVEFESEAGPTAVVIGPSLGWLEPCGCSGGQLGGVHRIGSALSIAGQGADPLRVACGGVIGPEVAGVRDWALAQLEATWDGLARMHFGVVGLSAAELELGAELAQYSALFYETTLVATNLEHEWDPEGEPPVFARRHHDAVRGLTVLSFLPDGRSGEGWRTVPARAALERLAAESPPAAGEALLVLVEGDATRVDELAEALTDTLGTERRIVLVQHGERGDADHELHAVGEHGVLAGFAGARLRYAIRVELGTPSWSSTPVSENLPADEELDSLREAYRVLLSMRQPTVAEQLADRLGAHAAGAFAGSQACESCHPDEFEIWQETLHSHAFESLAGDFRGTRPATDDPHCLQCHTVGYGYRTGFASETLEADVRLSGSTGLGDVGCESCHGPGAKHARSQLTDDIDLGRAAPGKLPLCMRCHDADNDPSFAFDKKWLQIRH